jgi:hypothetical protein
MRKLLIMSNDNMTLRINATMALGMINTSMARTAPAAVMGKPVK